MSAVVAAALFAVGVVALAYGVETFVGALVGAAGDLDVSPFALSVVLAGVEFDDAVLGAVTAAEGLAGVALGSALGTALSLSGVSLALAALVHPFEVSVPDDYLVVFAAAPLAPVAAAASGTLTTRDGALLALAFAAALGYLVWRETGDERPVLRDAAVHEVRDGGVDRSVAAVPLAPAGRSGVAALAVAVVALAAVIAGAEAVAVATERLLAANGLDGTVFGATAVTAALTVEDVLLTVEPVRRGVPEVGVGNVVGSVVFSATANLAVVALAGGGAVGDAVLAWHLPALVATTALAAAFLRSGRLRRRHGAVLLACYVGYWAVSLVAFGGVPLDA